MSLRVRLAVVAVAFALLGGPATGQTSFTVGNLVVYRVGDGTAALSGSATAGFLDEISTGGSLAQSIALPTTMSGSNLRLTANGTATSEGFLTLSPNGQYLALTGYDAAVGTVSPQMSSATTINRVIGIVGNDGIVNTSTAFNQQYGAANIRSAVTDGTTVWASGGSAPSAGVNIIGVGTVGSGTQLTSAPTNTRAINIFNGQLYATTGSTGFIGLNRIGTGVPTTGGNTTTLMIPTTSGTGAPSPYGFAISPDGLTAYVADDRSTANGGGVQKWVNNSGTWSLAYSINFSSGGSAGGARGLTVDFSGSDPILYATTADNSANRLVTFTDLGTNFSSFTLLATAPVNTAFRGVAFAPSPINPVPEPTTVLAFSAAGLGFAGLVRRMRHKAV